jgi:glutathionyl-hydroquinone reductase
MGVLLNGRWTDGELPQETGGRGQFQRVECQFRERVNGDGSSTSRPKRAGIISMYRMGARGHIVR